MCCNDIQGTNQMHTHSRKQEKYVVQPQATFKQLEIQETRKKLQEIINHYTRRIPGEED